MFGAEGRDRRGNRQPGTTQTMNDKNTQRRRRVPPLPVRTLTRFGLAVLRGPSQTEDTRRRRPGLSADSGCRKSVETGRLLESIDAPLASMDPFVLRETIAVRVFSFLRSSGSLPQVCGGRARHAPSSPPDAVRIRDGSRHVAPRPLETPICSCVVG